MRDPARIQRILGFIGMVWMKYPDLRLAQLLINATGGIHDQYYLEDDELEELLRETYKL